MGDDKESHRIKDAKDREDAFLENAVRQGDVRQDKDEEAEKRMSPITPTAINPTASISPATPTAQENEVSHAPIFYEDILMQNDFHDVVNQDQAMYDDINSVPDNSEDMIGSIIGIVQKHVSEVWSPPRVTALASKYGLTPGSAYDIETNDSNGKAWDFDIPEQRNQCVREI